MSKKIVLSVSAALVLVAATTVSSQAASSSPAKASGDESRTFTLISKSLQSGNSDIPPEGTSVGDSFTFSDTLLQKGKKVGMDGGTCTVVNLGKTVFTAQCLVTASLPKGDLTLQGFNAFPVNNGPAVPFTLAITGGTGAYETAQGEATAADAPNGDTRIVVHLVLDD